MRLRALLGLALLAAGCSPAARVTGRVEIVGADSAAGVVVRLLGAEQTTAVTDASGQFELLTSSPRPTLWVTAEAVTPRSQTVSILDPAQPLVIRFTAVGGLTGTALRGGAATGNSAVAVSIVGGGQTVASDTGAWSLEVPAGTHLVRAIASGYGAALSAPVTVKRGQQVEVVPLILPLVGFGHTGALSGRVERAGSTQHDGVQVLIEGAGRTTVTAGGGRFEITGVPEGSYTLVLDDHGLVERVPNVVVTRGADGFLVDQNLYRLGDRPIVLMNATRLESTRARLSPIRPPYVAWLASDATQNQTHVRWAEASKDLVREAGRVANAYQYEVTTPRFSPDGSRLVWTSNDGNLQATSIADGTTEVLATGFRRGIGWDGRVTFPISPSGLVAFEGFLPESNFNGLRVASLTRAPPVIAHAWQDSNHHVYGARFWGEALISLSDVYDYSGTLRWWTPGEPERTLSSSAGSSSFRYGGSTQRFIEIGDGWQGTHQLIDLEKGTVVHTHGSGAGTFSADAGSYAWNNGSATRVLELPSLTETTAFAGPLDLQSCVVGTTVVGQKSSGEIVSATNGVLVTLAPAPQTGKQRQISKCTGGRVYFGEWPIGQYAKSSLFEVPVAGGPLVELGAGPIATYALEVRDGHVWYASGSHNLSSGTYGALWRVPQGGGTPVLIAEEVRLYPRMLEPSPDQQRLAILTSDGLYVMEADGSGLRRLATGVDEVAWLSNQQLVFTIPPPPAPFTFQGGVYFARP